MSDLLSIEYAKIRRDGPDGANHSYPVNPVHPVHLFNKCDSMFDDVGLPQGQAIVFARSDICYEIFNEAVDNGYVKSKTLDENEVEVC